MKKTLPCVFCGSSDIVTVTCESDDDYAQLRCDKCMATGPLTDQIGGWWRPRDAWNKHDLPALQAAAKQLGYVVVPEASMRQAQWYWGTGVMVENSRCIWCQKTIGARECGCEVALSVIAMEG